MLIQWEDRSFNWSDVIYTIRIILYAIMTAMGIFMEEEKDKFKDEALGGYEKLKSDIDSKMDYGSINEISLSRKRTSPEEKANFFSKISFHWCSYLLKLGYNRALVNEDLWPLIKTDTSDTCSTVFEGMWKEEIKKEKPSIFKPLAREHGWYFAFAGLLKLFGDLLSFSGPLLLNYTIRFVNEPSWPYYYGLIIAGLFLLTGVLQIIFNNYYFFIVVRIGLRIRSAIVTTIYRKAFNINSSSRQQFTTGEIVNNMSVDANRLRDLTLHLHSIWAAPMLIAITLYLLWAQVGPSVFAGLGVMFLMIPFNGILIKKLVGYQKSMMINKDRRIKLMNEILQGIRIIKFFAWENSYTKKVNGVRTEELKTLRSSLYLQAGTVFLWTSTPLLVSLATFTTFSLSGNALTAEVAFTSLSLFSLLGMPLNLLPNVINGCVEARISKQRIQKYLLSEDRDPNNVKWDKKMDLNDKNAVEIQNATFLWEKDKESILTDINFKVNRGEFVAVVGAVGSGKSSLLSAILGDMQKQNGSVSVNGTISYSTQQAWIQNASVRDNILFGKEFNKKRYSTTISISELESDLEILPGGDATEIGENGINLSGGQKQRVSIARSIYQDSDIYLMDDILSAVDVHVGQSIFENCLMGELKNKTRVLVTHQLQYLSQVDKIYVLQKGSIIESGSYDHLLSIDGEFSRLINNYNIEKKEGKEKSDEETTQKEVSSKKPKESKIVSVEERDVGKIDRKIYKDYILSIGGPVLLTLILLTFLIESIAKVGGNFWLSHWSNDSRLFNHGVGYYLGIYASWGAVNCFMVFVRSLALAYACINASRSLHTKLLSRIFRVPVSFYDTTPTGRILNRFSKDIQSLDEIIPRIIVWICFVCFSCVGVMVVIATVTPMFLIIVFPMAVFYKNIQGYYVSSIRELKRLDSISRSPIYTHFTETLNGTASIRAFQEIERFTKENEERLDLNQSAYFVMATANRWLAVRLEFIGTFVIFFATLLAIFERSTINAGLVGLSISYALQLTGLLNYLVRLTTEFETEMVSVERIVEYSKLEEEAPYKIENNKPPHNWPESGEIIFNNYKLRYRMGLDLVLKGVNAKISPCQKVGIVGRTGAGKSSLILGLFRIVEAAEGSIVIDNYNISKIGLLDLRSKLAIIPQDPVLFTGTMRSNLDPFEEYDDNDLWRALEKVHLKDTVTNMEGKLDGIVTEKGENFSVGQRQLVCLARALLRKSKIIVMDEATSNVDIETDSLIQKTIREEFKDRTILTIAHRINTILDYDRIMVINSGVVAEFDSPQNLLDNQKSIFYSMVHANSK